MRLSPCVTLVVLSACGPAAAQEIYFADVFNPDPNFGAIRRINADGSGLTTLLEIGGGLRGVAIDRPGNSMYWADVNNFVIRRADLNGANVQDIITSGLEFPSALRLEPGAGRLYWGDQLSNELRRATVTGTGNQLLRSTLFHRGLAIDESAGKLYWTTSLSMYRGDILRSNLDGGGLQTVVTSALPEFKPASVALDIAGGKIYWTDYVVDVVRRANLDGSNVEDLYAAAGNYNPGGIALDLVNRKVYWGQDQVVFGSGAALMRMELDGALPEVVRDGFGHVFDITIVPTQPPPCYANCDRSTTAPILNVNDFICFQQKFAAGNSEANCDGSTALPTLNVNDFICFQSRFAAGCP